MRALVCAGMAGVFGFAAFSAAAQNQPANPRDSSLQNNLPRQPAPDQPSSSRIQPPAQREQGDDDRPVRLDKLQIAGVRSVPFAEAVRIFEPLLHTDTTVGALVKAADRLTALYRERGYALSYAYVPAQDLSSGTIQVVAVEGYVASLRLENAPPKLEEKIRAIAAHILAERPLRTATFERYVSLVARLPDVGVDANVPVPDTIDGATQLQLRLRHRPVLLSASFDANHPGFEAVLGASINGVTTMGDQLSLSVMAPRGRYDKGYYALDYSLPLGTDGLAFKLGGYHYQAVDRDFFFGPDVLQRSYRDARVTALLSYPVLLRANRAVFVEGGGYVANTGDVFTEPPFPDRLDLRARVRALQGGVNATWQTKTSASEASLQVSQGLRDSGARQEADLIDLSFHRARLFVRRNDQWANGKFATFVAVTAQQSPSRLPLTEKISFGGNFFGAAYRPGELAGDSGWGAAGEISKSFPVDFKAFRRIEPYLGADYARATTSRIDFRPQALTSAIVGIRVALPGRYQLSLSAAKPVGAAPALEPSRPWRMNLQGSVTF